MALKIHTSRPEKWIKFDNGSESAEFLVRPLTAKENEDLLRKHTEYVWERNQRFEQLHLAAFIEEKLDRVLQDWKEGDVLGDEGEALTCTEANKKLFARFNPEIAAWVRDQADELMKQREAVEESARKNSETGRKK